ncbi:MAG: aminopeptidase N [Bdellovibrionaceae bacterium]|nr:aminopeptidase N [Pseudobdellovibrionaceae bacterium]
MLRILLAGIWLFLLSCSTSSIGGDARLRGVGQGSDLLWTEAQSRKARLDNVAYTLKVDLTPEGDEFLGSATLNFDLKDPAQALRVDFFEGRVTRIEINGQAQPLTIKKDYWVELPAAALKAGANTVAIDYAQKYSRTGQGLHRFKDPEDGQFYLHTQFQPFDANRFMPCFDQPDLRATLKLQVTAPMKWQVVTATMETSKKASGSHQVWDFPPTPKIATYLFSLHAGPYQMMRDQYGDVPLRIFVRPALAKYLNSNDWFMITKQGFRFFENYFGVKYPFKKYDQLIVPEFSFGGMENVAAVTYTESSVTRSNPTRRQRRGVAGLMLHEMAHMWFGDLVTMAWWNDLWLNESFATLMSSIAVAQSTEFKEEWQGFAANLKRWAYMQDAMETTHPIEAQVSRVKEALANFDGITYNKGAAVMKQLRYYMTETAFRKGIQDYMKTYAYKNTTLPDFIGSLQAHTQKDLTLWADSWLRQSGTDQVATNWACEGDKLKAITLTMTPSKGAQFRPQALEVGLFGLKGDRVVALKQVRAELNGPAPLTLKGDWACPDFVYPNNGDHAYVNVKLDPNSLKLLETRLSDIQDLLVRSLVWNDLWRMVRESELPLKNYVAIVERNFQRETDEIILQQVVGTVGGGSSVLTYWPVDSDEQRAARTEFVRKFETDFLARLKLTSSGSDGEKFWVDNLIRFSETPTGLDAMAGWLKANRVSTRMPLDPDRKWGIVRQLVRFNHASANEAFERLKAEDRSDRGAKSALAVEAITPAAEVKSKWVNEITSKTASRPLEELQVVAYSLFPQEQDALKIKYEPAFFDYLAKNKNSEDEARSRTVIQGLLPLRCETKASVKLKETIEKDRDINPMVLKSIKMSLEEDERCQRIRRSF